MKIPSPTIARGNAGSAAAFERTKRSTLGSNPIQGLNPRVESFRMQTLARAHAEDSKLESVSTVKPQSVINPRSAALDANTLSSRLLPWQLYFDRFLIDPVLPPLVNDTVQPRWFESVKDPGRAGPYKVHQYFINLKPQSTGRDLNAQVFAPSQGQKTQPSPVVLVSPPCFVGELGLPFDQKFYDIQPYTSFMRHFASMGYVVVGLYEHKGVVFEKEGHVDHDRDGRELKSITDQLFGEDSPIQEAIQKDHLAVMGHSKGGKMGFYHAALDPRVKLILSIDPVNMGGPPWFVSKTFADNPVVPIPGIAEEGKFLIDDIDAKLVLMRAPPDFVNFDSRFNASHFWDAFSGDGLYIDCKATHGDWLLRQDLREVTRRVFTAALMDVFHPDKPFANELRAVEIKTKTPHLIQGVQRKSVTPPKD